ncbi:MAG: hypothetical protein ACOX9R_18760, partial [Armatimonadota bacterium]
PVRDFGLTGDSVLFNGDFERGGSGWSLPANSQGEITDEMAAVGERALKIIDDSDTRGSNVTSARITVDGTGSWLLRGQVHHVSGSGIGMYIRFYDEAGRQLNEADARGNIAAVGSLDGGVGEWAPFEFTFETPEGTASMELWIHSFNAARVTAFIDGLAIVPAQ